MEMKKLIALGVGLLFCGALPLAGQRPEQEMAARERIRDNINRLRLLRMTEELGLTEDQTAVIFPAASRLEKEKAEISRKIGQAVRELRAILRDANPDPKELNEKVKVIKELRRQIQEKDLEFEKILENNLDENQKARYVLFSLDFYRVLGEKLERARKSMRNRREL